MNGSVASGAQPCLDDEAVPARLVGSCVVRGFEEQPTALPGVEVARGGQPAGGEGGPVELLAESRTGRAGSAGAHIVEERGEDALSGRSGLAGLQTWRRRHRAA